MATAVPQQRNAVVDIAEVLGKIAPLFIGSGATSTTQSAYSSIDPTVAGQSDDLLQQLLGRANSTTQADNVVNDILYRAQLAFAPVLGEEKSAGLYNTTVRQQLGKEAVARATAAASQAVLQDQQHALAQATQLTGTRVQASRNQTQTQQQKTAPAVSPMGLLKGLGVGILGSLGVKKGRAALEDILDKLPKTPGKGVDSGDYEDASGNVYDIGSSASDGAAGGIGGTGGGDASVSGGSFSANSLAPLTADDNAALQNLIDSTKVPQIGDNPQVASAGVSDSPIVSGGETPLLGGVTVGSSITNSAATGAITLGYPGEEAAANLYASTPAGEQSAAFADEVQKRIEAAGVQPGSPEAEAIGLQVQDEFGFKEATTSTASTGGEALAATGVQAVTPEASVAYDPSVWDAADAEFGANALGADSIGLDLGVPYLTIANIATGGQISQAISDIPIVGDLYQGVNEAATGVVSAAGDAVSGAAEAVGDIFDTFTGGGKVICTEAVRQGLMSKELVQREIKQNIEVRKISNTTFLGYQYLALPIVARMKVDREYAERWAKRATRYCQQVTGDKWTVFGWIGQHALEALCWIVGSTVARNNILVGAA